MKVEEIGGEVLTMAGNLLDMLDLIERGFMANDATHLEAALEKEAAINNFEKSITMNIFELSKSGSDRIELLRLAQVVETLERMGDEASNLIERIEIKVQEKLLFSEEGVEQFNETYNAMRKSVSMMLEFLKRSPDPSLKERIIDNGFHVKELVERYRKEHTERYIRGVCTPMGANMYFDMLDFTGNLARHASNVVKLF